MATKKTKAKRKPMSWERFDRLFNEVNELARKFDDPETGIYVLIDQTHTLALSHCKNEVTLDAIEDLCHRLQMQWAWEPEARA